MKKIILMFTIIALTCFGVGELGTYTEGESVQIPVICLTDEGVHDTGCTISAVVLDPDDMAAKTLTEAMAEISDSSLAGFWRGSYTVPVSAQTGTWQVYINGSNSNGTNAATTLSFQVVNSDSGFNELADKIDSVQADLDNPSQFKATGFSTHSAADVWSSGTRTLTGFTALWVDSECTDAAELTAAQTAITDNVTGEANQLETLISALNDITAQNVWEYATRTLTGFSANWISSEATSATELSTALNLLNVSLQNYGDLNWGGSTGLTAAQNATLYSILGDTSELQGNQSSFITATDVVCSNVSDKTGYSLSVDYPTWANLNASLSTYTSNITVNSTEIQESILDYELDDAENRTVKQTINESWTATFKSGGWFY